MIDEEGTDAGSLCQNKQQTYDKRCGSTVDTCTYIRAAGVPLCCVVFHPCLDMIGDVALSQTWKNHHSAWLRQNENKLLLHSTTNQEKCAKEMDGLEDVQIKTSSVTYTSLKSVHA